MKIYNSIQEFIPAGPTIATLGTFDGVHKGHKSILEKLINSSRATGHQSLVLTFFPHPRMVLQQNTDIRLLNTMAEKAHLLENFGIDNLIIHPFNHEFSRITAEEFVSDVLVGRLNISKIIIGYDHRFGRNRTADINDLKQFGQQYGFEVVEISALEVNEVSVSSTKIRHALNEGHIKTANKYLGYPYFIGGRVVKGRQLGHKIGYPTANIEIPENYKLIPANGVYAISAQWGETVLLGMMNIGVRPTVDGTNRVIEAHFFDFEENLYDKDISINLHYRLRDEKKFESVEALTAQLHADKKDTLAYFNQNKL